MRFAIPLQSPDTAARWTLRAVCLVALALPLSFSGGAIALPAIARDLGGSPAALNWVTNAFMLAFGSLLMAAGMLADRYGRRRVFLAGAAGFALASIGVCAAPGIVVLDLLRAAQGVAAAMALAGGSAALAQAFAGQARTRAFGLLGATFGAGLALGPLLAGLLVERIGWRAVFALGALLGMLACGLACRAMAESHGERGAAPDWPGAATLTASLSLLTLTLIEAPRAGLLAGSTLACAGASAACGALFVWIERRCRHPMLDLSLFRYPRFVGVQLLPIATCYGFVVLLVLLPLHLVGILGLPEIQAGGLMLALSGPMLLVPLLAARLAARWPAGRLCAFGLGVAALGLAWLASSLARPPLQLVAPLLLIGAGTGLPWGLMDDLSVSLVPTARAGMAAGIFGTTRVAGEGIALALVSALLSGLTLHALLPADAAQAALGAAAAALAAGDLQQAGLLVPSIDAVRLVAAQTQGLQLLVGMLSAITVVAALVIALMLGRPAPAD